MKPVVPTPSYDEQNEAQFRRIVQEDSRHTLKDNQGFPSFIMLDSVDGQAYLITLVSGVLTPTVIP